MFSDFHLEQAGERDASQRGGEEGVLTDKLDIKLTVVRDLEKHTDILSEITEFSSFYPRRVLQDQFSIELDLLQTDQLKISPWNPSNWFKNSFLLFTIFRNLVQCFLKTGNDIRPELDEDGVDPVGPLHQALLQPPDRALGPTTLRLRVSLEREEATDDNEEEEEIDIPHTKEAKEIEEEKDGDLLEDERGEELHPPDP